MIHNRQCYTTYQQPLERKIYSKYDTKLFAGPIREKITTPKKNSFSFHLRLNQPLFNNFIVKNNVNSLDQVTIQSINKAQSKLCFNLNTIALGVYLYYSVFINPEQQMKNIGICLCLSAKFLQKGNKKLIPKLIKYFKRTFSKDDYIETQAQILSKTNYNLNIYTFVQLILQFLNLNKNYFNQSSNISKLEQSLIQNSKKVIFNGNFMKFKPEDLFKGIIHNCFELVQLIKQQNLVKIENQKKYSSQTFSCSEDQLKGIR